MTDNKARFDVMGQLPALRRYGLALTRNAADAEDLVNEALLRAYEKRAGFRSDKNLRVWLLSILHNCFIDGKRRERAEHNKLAGAAELAESHAAPAQEHAVHLAQVRQAFLTLPEEQRAALHLVAIEGLSYQEAAATLAIPIGTLMSRLGRARAALRALEDTGDAQTARLGHLRIVGGTDDTAG
ncbi:MULTISPECIES: sigma-70 family RNA polymerase sigma factor [Rhodomicrobium]|uniref:sigma-70 family RNA polymerase sigma factor n=1 Tax=Rhodomicrobium TaxID=1068 RepID=UPI000B4BAF53|nr:MULTISPECIES: sigma-70 family RNA polymerase sigma factor [Rhodomicrobium]